MAERTKSFIPIIATKERILGTEIPQKEGQTFLTKDGKFSYFDKGGERYLLPKFGVIEKNPGNEFGVFLRDYASLEGSLIISRDEATYKMFYVDTEGAVYELSNGGGGSGGGGFSTNAMTLGGFGPEYYLDYSKFTGTPVLADVATSGDYNDLSNKPTIPTLNGVVKTTGDQLIEGKKTFKNETEFGSGSVSWSIQDQGQNDALRFIFNGGTAILPKVTTGSIKTIAFTDIIPATTVANKLLVSTTTSGIPKWSDWSSAGFLKTNASGIITIDTNTYSLSSHSHDDKYYTKNQTDTLLNSKLNIALKGSANGLAELDETGKVPSSQLPSYVDDVLEYDSLIDFPVPGEGGKIYIAKDTNLTYRWGGSTYVLISSALALGETSSTAYRGDRGKIAYDHSQVAHAPSNAQPNQTVSPGAGMDFAATTGNVTITMGDPSDISISTQNSANGTTHTHKLVLPQDIQTTANPTFAGVNFGSGSKTWTIDDTTSNTLSFKLASTEKVKFVSGDGIYFEGTKVGSGSVTSVSLASGTNNGTLKLTVNGTTTDNIAVKGLGSAAYTDKGDYVLTTRKVNGQALSDDVTITATDLNLGTDSSPTFAGLNVGTGSPTWTIDDAEENTLSFKLASTEKVKFVSGDGIYFEGAKVGSGSVNSVSLASGTNNGTLKLTVNGTATDNIAVKGLGSAAYTSASSYEPAIGTKGTAFNKNFGTTAGTVAQGNDARLSDARTPLSHSHGSIANNGVLTSTRAVTDGDRLVISGSSSNTGLSRGSTLSFDSSSTASLRRNGTWEDNVFIRTFGGNEFFYLTNLGIWGPGIYRVLLCDEQNTGWSLSYRSSPSASWITLPDTGWVKSLDIIVLSGNSFIISSGRTGNVIGNFPQNSSALFTTFNFSALTESSHEIRAMVTRGI